MHKNKRKGSEDGGHSIATLSSDDDEVRESGVGILEFSPDKAGQDVTPANFNFGENRDVTKRSSGTFSSIAGRLENYIRRIFCQIWYFNPLTLSTLTMLSGYTFVYSTRMKIFLKFI